MIVYLISLEYVYPNIKCKIKETTTGMLTESDSRCQWVPWVP